MVDRKFTIGLFSWGLLQSFENQVAFYEPIPEWVTGMAIVQFAEVIEQKQPSTKETMSV